MRGPLDGLAVVELGGMGPGPFGAMVLADLGADVIRVDRPADVGRPAGDAVLRRSRRSIAVDLKDPAGVEVVLRLVDRADVLIEGFRPGVTERLGLGPDVCRARNEGLVYARMTGWGQHGPLAATAGHDINYIALAGALGAIGRQDTGPVPPLSLVGDFGGGGMLLAVGVLAAVVARSTTGRGQVVDAAMVDGAATLMALFLALHGAGHWHDQRQANLLDGGAYFYGAYETADGRYLSIGAIEPQFHAELLRLLELDPAEFDHRHDQARWPARRRLVADAVRRRSRDDWVARFAGSDACVAPVLDLAEVPTHPHHVARGSFVEVDGMVQPVPSPRFDGTPCAPPSAWAQPGAATEAVLLAHGYDAHEVATLVARGVVRGPEDPA